MGAISQKSAEFLLRSRLADAEAGDVDALFELGVTYSTGRGGIRRPGVSPRRRESAARVRFFGRRSARGGGGNATALGSFAPTQSSSVVRKARARCRCSTYSSIDIASHTGRFWVISAISAS